jgi:hypothetical protein
MTLFHRSNSATFAGRAERLLLMLASLPALVFSPLGAEAIVIHYDGHDVHAHTVVGRDLDSWVEAAEHEHAAHEHDCQSLDPHEHGAGDILIVLELPDAVLRARGLGSGVVLAASSAAVPPLSVGIAIPFAVDVPLHVRSSSLAFTLKPYRTVAGILLSNHALLL